MKIIDLRIDSHNMDDTAKRSRPVHFVLLADEIFIVEHLRDLRQAFSTMSS